jgi:hypothetical protein
MPQATEPGGIGRATLIPRFTLHGDPHEGNRGIASLFGLAPGGVYRAPDVTTGTGALLPHRFTLTRIRGVAARRSTPAPGGLFSVALSLGSPPLDVIQHPALRSPDFPRLARTARRDHLISSVLLSLSPDRWGGKKWGRRRTRQRWLVRQSLRRAKVRYACSEDRTRGALVS